jgi:MOSC domain-containing protein
MTQNLSLGTARLDRIQIFPIKSLPAVALAEAAVCSNGALQNDRRWALVDGDGKFVNGKRTARIHLLEAAYAPDLAAVTLSAAGRSAETFPLQGDRARVEHYFADFFGFRVRVVEQPEGGFPDDTAAPGPTLISTATLEAVAGWFPALSVESVRQRFRTNLEIATTEPFWEDRLFGPDGSPVEFRIGAVLLAGTNPCQRCVVPTRDPATGEIYPRFTMEFSKRREQTLPAWAEASRFNHFYRLAVNTRGVDCPPAARVRVGEWLVVED